MSNAMNVIFPYRLEGIWVFDDRKFDVYREPFVFGASEMIDELLEELDYTCDKFRLIFSSKEFPGSHRTLSWDREECEGNWYSTGGEEGWLCPAMFNYFEAAPPSIFVRAELID